MKEKQTKKKQGGRETHNLNSAGNSTCPSPRLCLGDAGDGRWECVVSSAGLGSRIWNKYSAPLCVILVFLNMLLEY